jgi:hypothetical protein
MENLIPDAFKLDAPGVEASLAKERRIAETL